MNSRKKLRSFYFSKNFNRKRRTLESRTNKTKDRIASRERQYLLKDSKGSRLIMAIGKQGTVVGSSVKGYDRRGGTWLRKPYQRYATTVLTSEYITSQLCIYCYQRIAHPVLGTSRCLNPKWLAFRCGRACNKRDVMSAVAIRLSAMTELILNKDLAPFSQKLRPQ